MSARIVKSTRALLLVFKFLGIFGCAIESEKLRAGTVFWRLSSLGWIALSYRLAGINARLRQLESRRFDALPKFTTRMGMFFAITSDAWIAIFRQNKIVQIFEHVDAYDRRLIDIGFARRDRCCVYWTMLSVPGLIAIAETLNDLVVETSTDSRPDYDDVWTYYASVALYIVVTKLTIIVDLIYRRFRYLNDEVAPRINHTNHIVYRHGRVSVNEARYMHAKLSAATEILMNVYGPWLILWFLVMMYTISKYVLIAPAQRFLPTAGLTGIWLVGLCVTCGRASDEANKLTRRLMENKSFTGDATDTVERIEMALYLCNHELDFAAMRIYTINRPFLLSVVGMMISYMTFIFPTNR